MTTNTKNAVEMQAGAVFKDKLYNATLRAVEDGTNAWSVVRAAYLELSKGVEPANLPSLVSVEVKNTRKDIAKRCPDMDSASINNLGPMQYARRIAGALNREGLTPEQIVALLPTEAETATQYKDRIALPRAPGGKPETGKPEAAEPEAAKPEASPLQEAADAAESGAVPFQREFATMAAQAAQAGHGLAFWQVACAAMRDYMKAHTVAAAPAKASRKPKPAAVAAIA